MARKRTIDQGQLLDAAERVIARDGAVKLTLDAVASEAGVSKASVLYDHKTKKGLVRAIIERAIERDNQFNNACSESLMEQCLLDQGESVQSPDTTPTDNQTKNPVQNPLPNTVIRGRIVAASSPFPEEFKSVALNLSAALALDEDFRQIIQKNQAQVIHNIMETSSNPRGGLLAYLALEGLKLLESLDYHQWEKDDRDKILREINWLVSATPEEVDLPNPTKTS